MSLNVSLICIFGLFSVSGSGFWVSLEVYFWCLLGFSRVCLEVSHRCHLVVFRVGFKCLWECLFGASRGYLVCLFCVSEDVTGFSLVCL